MNSAALKRRSITWPLLAPLLFWIGVLVYFLWMRSTRVEGSYSLIQVALLWVFVLTGLLWTGNLLIHRLFHRSPKQPPFHIRLLISLLYSLACVNISYYAFKVNFTTLPPDHNQMILLNIYGLFFLMPVISTYFGLFYMQKWKRTLVEKEALQKEHIQSELATLKSHISPHFLFNNLSILSSLINAENEPAQDFLEHFAEVYRYVLQSRESELVPLEQEVEFLVSYRHLLETRFGSAIRWDIHIDDEVTYLLLPPLALQMVLENAIKHNKLSVEDPLVIEVFTNDSPELVVRNAVQLRPLPPEQRTHFGLNNIAKRYALLTRKDVKVEMENGYFTVCLPLVTPA